MTAYDASIPAERGANKPRIVHALEGGRIEIRLPDELERLDQYMHVFGTGEDGAPIKRPRIAGTPIFGSKTDPAHWRSFAVVRDAVRRFGGYPYLVVTPDDPYALIDFDKCRDPLTGELTPWVCGYLDRLGTYSEVSTSGTGVRAVVKSDRHFKSCKAAKMDGRAVEVYAHGHGCIMTGKTLNDAQIRSDVDDVLDELRADVAPVAAPRPAYRRKHGGPESRIEDMPIPGLLSKWLPDACGIKAYVACPWSEDHSSYSGASEAAVGQIVDADGKRGGLWFVCLHASHEDKRWADFRHVTIPPRVVRSGERVLAGSVFGGSR
jgi:hypothetical protein